MKTRQINTRDEIFDKNKINLKDTYSKQLGQIGKIQENESFSSFQYHGSSNPSINPSNILNSNAVNQFNNHRG
jgi:hypothetical protein